VSRKKIRKSYAAAIDRKVEIICLLPMEMVTYASPLHWACLRHVLSVYEKVIPVNNYFTQSIDLSSHL